MRKGGYKIIDLKNIDVSSTGATIPGVYNAIEETNKAILISGLNDGLSEYDDIFVVFGVSGTDFVAGLNLGGVAYTLTVDDDDKVVLAVVE